MAPTRRPSDGLLARVNFPLYAVDMLTSRHILVAGGGGSSKTGVANGFEIYELYHNGSHFCAEEVLRHETGANVVMNFAVRNSGRRAYLCAGQEAHCQMYFVQPQLDITSDASMDKKLTQSDHPHENGVRHRGVQPHSGVETLSNGNNCHPPTAADVLKQFQRLQFDIQAADVIQTDFLSNGEPLQRVVRISSNGRLMATGGTDGQLRVWTFPQMQLSTSWPAHNKEIDDLDFSPDCKYIVSISKDAQGIVWDLSTGKQQHKLKWQTQEGNKYLFKRCRYGTVEGHKDNYRLFTVTNPLGKVGKQRGFVQQWDCKNGELRVAASVDESLSSLAVRDDGRFVAVGTMFSGSVSIYVAFSLQRVLHIPHAHSMFVTGLQFLPITNEEGPPISSDTEAAVLSISVDNKVCIHSLPQRKTIPAWLAVVFMVIMIFIVLVLCSYIGI
ncbi:prolactin regulatory element-binding protein [Drosophila nasuta]|uniref:prolactin regulatory element-binding protein n=1 Tax=Drosophila nasuta TaxID=42062 RepID=UPI00295E8DD9|nr:prolactin regulatory element-binding protein [Drosophila nasuta]XP_060665243.1 prolactin regulatory element-binding protein [Drosophila nasuta]